MQRSDRQAADHVMDRLLKAAHCEASELAFHLVEARGLHGDHDLDLDLARALDQYMAPDHFRFLAAGDHHPMLEEDRRQVSLLALVAGWTRRSAPTEELSEAQLLVRRDACGDRGLAESLGRSIVGALNLRDDPDLNLDRLESRGRLRDLARDLAQACGEAGRRAGQQVGRRGMDAGYERPDRQTEGPLDEARAAAYALQRVLAGHLIQQDDGGNWRLAPASRLAS
jgi:hypothetical protein